MKTPLLQRPVRRPLRWAFRNLFVFVAFAVPLYLVLGHVLILRVWLFRDAGNVVDVLVAVVLAWGGGLPLYAGSALLYSLLVLFLARWFSGVGLRIASVLATGVLPLLYVLLIRTQGESPGAFVHPAWLAALVISLVFYGWCAGRSPPPPRHIAVDEANESAA